MFCGLINYLDNLDRIITVTLNFNGGHLADITAVGLSSRYIWIPVGMLFIYKIMAAHGNKYKRIAAIILGLAVVVTLCDQISASVMKPFFAPSTPVARHASMRTSTLCRLIPRRHLWLCIKPRGKCVRRGSVHIKVCQGQAIRHIRAGFCHPGRLFTRIPRRTLRRRRSLRRFVRRFCRIHYRLDYLPFHETKVAISLPFRRKMAVYHAAENIEYQRWLDINIVMKGP